MDFSTIGTELLPISPNKIVSWKRFNRDEIGEVKSVDIDRHTFINCEFERLDFSNTNFSEVRFLNCRINYCVFDYSWFYDTVFDNCVFEFNSFEGVMVLDKKDPFTRIKGISMRNSGKIKGIVDNLSVSKEIDAWKKVVGRDGSLELVQLKISADVPRVKPYGQNKCRAERAFVVNGPLVSESWYRHSFRYYPGTTVIADNYNPDPWEVCSGGIHFFLTREEAENYTFY